MSASTTMENGLNTLTNDTIGEQKQQEQQSSAKVDEERPRTLILREMFPDDLSLPEDKLSLAISILNEDDDATRDLYSRLYGKIFTALYDWVVIIFMLLLGLVLDIIASLHNAEIGHSAESASGAFDTAFLGVASSLIVLVSQIDNWYKSHNLGADAAIGAVIIFTVFIKSLKTAYEGRAYIALPEWVFAFFVFVQLFMTNKHVSSLTTVILFVNLAINCILLRKYYPLLLMLGMLFYIRGDVKWVDSLLKKMVTVIRYSFYLLLIVVGFVLLRAQLA